MSMTFVVFCFCFVVGPICDQEKQKIQWILYGYSGAFVTRP